MSKILFTLMLIFSVGGVAMADTLKDCEAPLIPLMPTTDLAESLSHQVAEKVNAKVSMRGYAVLIGTMVGSAVLTSSLSSHLPSDYQFASVFIGQISTLGVYVLGAPIWEPLSSRFRKWAFGMSNETWGASSQHLEATWTRTQEHYSLNAQMSRNVMSQFILTVKDNFYQAYRAHVENNTAYSADQIAEAAYRMRILFKEISPTDQSVAAAVATAFTHHVTIDSQTVDLIWKRLQILDSEILEPKVRLYYESVLATWLGR